MLSRNTEEVTAARALAPGLGHFARQSAQGSCSNTVQQVLLLCKHTPNKVAVSYEGSTTQEKTCQDPSDLLLVLLRCQKTETH